MERVCKYSGLKFEGHKNQVIYPAFRKALQGLNGTVFYGPATKALEKLRDAGETDPVKFMEALYKFWDRASTNYRAGLKELKEWENSQVKGETYGR